MSVTIDVGGDVAPQPNQRLRIQERDVSYRFSSHFHPYVGRLVQELLSNGMPGLQATDTLYTPDGASLPDGVELVLPAAAEVVLTTRTRLALSAEITFTHTDGALVTASFGMITLFAAGTVTAPDGMAVTLTASLTPAPAPGSDVQSAASLSAYVRGHAKVSLKAGVVVFLSDGST